MENTDTGIGIGKLALALSKAQAAFPKLPKDKTAKVRMKSGGTYEYKYTDLSTVIETVKAALAGNELSISQLIQSDGQKNWLETLLLHSSGQHLKSIYDLPKGLSPQEYGSAITYARRYSICAITGIAGDEDEDGQVAQEAAKPKRAENPPPREQPRNFANDVKINMKQIQMLFAANDKYGLKVDEMRAMIKTLTGKESTKDLTNGELQNILNLYKQYPNKDDLVRVVANTNSNAPNFDEAEELPF